MKRKSSTLKVERLEDRTVPATFGHPWADAQHITLSFVPDGTNISGVSSNLNATLSGIGGDAARDEILRAFQTWVANANVNIGLMSDNGDAFDAPGQVQGDVRFGDIRLGGRAWAGDVLALTTPFNYFNTQSGNVAVNTAATFSIGGSDTTHDLYTVLLQESGHSLGVSNSPNITSVMYEYYQGTRTDLSADDIASIQALYGARQPDAFEGMSGNGTLATATTYSGPLTADLTTTSDVDVYRFTTAAGGSPIAVHLNAAGVSLVQAKVEILNAFGQVVAQGAAQGTTSNDVNVTLSSPLPLNTYYVRVSSNRSDVFGVGSYKLSIDGTTAGAGGSTSGTTNLVSGDHSTFNTAATLTQTVSTVNQQLDYFAQVAPPPTNTTYTCVHSPTATSGQTVHMVVSVYDLGSLQNVQVTVYDANYNPLAARVLSAGTGSAVVEVDNVQGNADYYIRVNSTTSFKYSVDFTTRDIPFELGSNGAAATGATQAATLSVCQSQVLYFLLSATGDSGAAAQMTVKDTNGNVVCVLTSYGGTSQSTSVFLAAGWYRVEISLIPDLLAPQASLTYTLSAAGITDPVGVIVPDPGTVPQGSTVPQPSSSGAIVYFTGDPNDPTQTAVWW
jgi:hypothetical protein